MNRYNLNENSKARKVFRVLGPILLGVGVLLTIAGFFSLFSGALETFFLGFIGLPVVFVGLSFTSLGYMGAMARYSASQTAPVAKDVTNYMIDHTTDSVAHMAGAVVKEVKGDTQPVVCRHCGEVAHAGALFCDNCGKPLATLCPKCHAENDQNARFCQKCGEPL